MKKVVIFDLDDTLYQILDCFKESIITVFPTFDESKIKELYKCFREHSNAHFERSQNREISMEEMRILRISKAMELFGASITKVEALKFQDVYAANVYTSKLPNEVISLLEYLKVNNIPRGIITNGESIHQWTKIDNFGLGKFFEKDKIIVSGDVGIDKPNIKIFQIMERRFPKESSFIYIGDSYENDIVGSANANWNNIWFSKDANLNRKFVNKVAISYEDLRVQLSKLLD